MFIMVEFLLSIIIVLLLQIGVIFLTKIIISRNNNLAKKSLDLPPSLPQPLSFPIVGNLLQLTVRPLDKLNQWNKKYGPIYGLNLGQKYFIVLNNHEVVNDLIVKSGSKYSSRYHFNYTNPVLIKSNLLALAPYGDKWKRDRSVAYSALTARPVKSYYSYIVNDSEIFLKDLMIKHSQPIYPLQIVKKFVLSNMLNILFGDKSSNDELLCNDIMKVMDDIAEYSSPISIIKDLMPILDYVYSSNNYHADKLHEQIEKIFSSKYDQFLNDYSEGKKLPPSFLSQIQEAIREKENSSIEYEDIWEMLVSLLNGAMETEVNTLMWVIACLANNPGVQEEAFRELDDICEKNKPTLEDELDLPYISAIINETLRYRPPTPFGYAHMTNKDDEYNGYFIPKDTPLLLNLFAINHNERRFIAPDTFRPSRFMQDSSTGSVKSKSILLPQFDFDAGIEGEMNRKRSSLKGLLKNNSPSLTNSSMPMHMSFGAGRRYCIGQHLAQKQLFLALAYILWAFEIKPGVEDDGITPLNVNLNGGNLSLTSFSPYPYKVRFILRKDIGLLI
uniref:Cytochrome P450 1A1 n=1 Tax=Anthurium amnicola TaxID=1678845 RepID=A0A1D1YZD1_9ARAE